MKTTLQNFKTGDFTQNALTFFEKLGYDTQFQQPLTQKNYAGFAAEFTPLNETNALVSEWNYVNQLFFLTPENTTLEALKVENVNIDAYLIFGIELKKTHYSRGDLVKITREFNRVFPRPVLILFKHGDAITLSVINRRIHKRDDNRDVLEKVTLIKDIRLENPHRAHLDILNELAFSHLKPEPKNFVELHNAWQAVLNTKELNKQFYEKLFDWYLYALSQVKFPQIRAEADCVPDEQHQSESLIRLLTRLLFVWFMKEKGLISAELFDPKELKAILKNFTGENCDDTIFYKAILQNLFFATLNMPIEKRKVIFDGFNPKDYGNQLVYRYAELFEAENFKTHFDSVPFLNGGLFDCLDQRKTDDSSEIRLDGFSTQAKKQAVVPDKLFFGEYKNVDLSSAYDNKKKSNVTVYGLIDILQNHKFTVEENTPLEEDIALDPELLGQVFENLLAAYNPETGTTARKQTGSFYTPREIVDYMVDESLIAYFESKSPLTPLQKGGDSFQNVDFNSGSFEVEHNNSPLFEGGLGGISLRELLNYENSQNPFDETQTAALIKAIDNLKILDPACGSGAFPMGILHKLVFILSKLDPKNEKWRDRQLAKLKFIDDSALREKAEKVINDAFENNELDYGRKLYLIENCIHGVDIQPIAVQISKLRFFISLIVDQKSDKEKPNFGIRALPNLDFKIIAANTLIGINTGINTDSTFSLFHNPKIEDLENKLKELRHKLFTANSPEQKKAIREDDEKLRNQISALLSQDKNEQNVAGQFAAWNPYNNGTHADFFDKEVMFGLNTGFDIVIGNPPYIKEYTHKSAFDGLRTSHYYKGKMDLWYFFVCKNLEITKNKTGILTFIATNNWTTNTGASKMRDKILKETTIEKLLDFGSYMIFESADIQTCVMMFRNDDSNDNYTFDFRRLIGNKLTFDDALDLITKTQTSNTEFLSPKISKNDLNGKTFTFSNNALDDVLSKIQMKGNFKLDGKIEVANGIHPHYDYVSKATQSILGDKFKVGQGIFVLSENEKADLELNEQELEIIKPYFTTEQLRKWFGKKENTEWIIYTDSTFKDAVNIEPYPNIKKHLDQFQNVITSDNKPYGLHRARKESFFKGEKIVALRKCVGEPIFTYTDFDCYVSATFYVIKSQRIDLKYLTAVLNSKVVAFWLKNKGKMQGQNYQLDKEPLLEIPIFKPAENQQQPFINLVDKILAEKKAGNDTRALEREIDLLVYGLYGLSDEEIKIIEGEK